MAIFPECPCGNDKSYKECCERIHKDLSLATTAEKLMRARYSAFVTSNLGFIMSSHHESTRPTRSKKEIKRWMRGLEWVELHVRNVIKGGAEDEEGYVDFRAFYKENDSFEILQEISRFVKAEDGNWYYISGEHKEDKFIEQE